MILRLKKFFIVLFCVIPTLCFGIDLDTKIAWEPWAVNWALMDFCVPELEDGDRMTEGGNMVWDKREYSSVGDISMLITHQNTVITREKVKLIPKCAAFVEDYISQTKENSKISLNQIISICLNTIEDKLMCESIVLTLVNLTRDTKVLKNYDPKKMEQKIHDTVKADRKICSNDGLFCTTYSLFSKREKWYSLENAETDAIYRKEDGKIIGVCAGVNYKDINSLTFIHKDSRCITTDSKYELYDFDIKDASENSISLVYEDYGKYTEDTKKYLNDVLLKKIQSLEKCFADTTAQPYTGRALNSLDSLGIVLCEKDNTDDEAIAVCKFQVLKARYNKIKNDVDALSFESVNKDISHYKSLLTSYFISAIAVRHQSDLLLSNCVTQ